METRESFSVVVPTYHRPAALRETLAALARLDYPSTSYQVIVVDDGPDEASERVVRQAQSERFQVLYLAQQNSGAASARNSGVRAAEGNLLLFCDDDMIVEPDHLLRQLRAREVHGEAIVNGIRRFSPEAAAVLHQTAFGRYRIDLELAFEAWADGRPLGGDRYEAHLLSASNLALGRDVFWELGGFDEAFPYAGAEDQDLSLKAREAGFLLIRDHGIRVLNNEQILTFSQFCIREERSAQTFAVLVNRFPDQAGRALFAENAPVARSDPPHVIAKKLVKSALGREPILQLAHLLPSVMERMPATDALLRRVYRKVLGLHINRGIRTALRNGVGEGRPITTRPIPRQAPGLVEGVADSGA